MTRQPYLSLGLQLILMSNISLINLTDAEVGPDSKTVVFRLSKDCRDEYIRLDKYDSVEFTSNEWSDKESPVESGVTCRAHFMSGNTDQGVCIRNNDLYFKRPGITMEFSTSQLGSEKILRRDFHQFREWCTSQWIVTISVTSHFDIRDQDDEYRFSFRVHNVSKSEIQQQYIMDSFKFCDRSYDLEQGEEIVINSQRFPRTSLLPLDCKVTLTSKSEDEYEELCVTLESYKKDHDCRSTLGIDGFLSEFWPKKAFLGCNDSAELIREEMCSSNKKLVFDLKRTNESDTGFYMRAVVKSKWHPKWEILSQRKTELRGLGFMKGLTYFIATVDILAGILAVALASMFRHPRWFWKDWANAKNSDMTSCEAVHYEGGDYPEPPNGGEVDKITEASAY